MVDAVEPSLFAGLDAQDVEDAVADRGGDQVVAAAQRVVSCAQVHNTKGRSPSCAVSATPPKVLGV